MKKPSYYCTLIYDRNNIDVFSSNNESEECMDLLNEINVKTVYEKREFHSYDKCIPIRLVLDCEDNTEDWTTYGSPISEIDYGNIIKYWPVELIKNNQDGDEIEIEFLDFKLTCKLKELNKEKKDMENIEETVKTVEPVAAPVAPAVEPVAAPVAPVVTNVPAVVTKKKMPKWAKAAIIGTTAAVVVGVVAAVVITKKKHDSEESAE